MNYKNNDNSDQSWEIVDSKVLNDMKSEIHALRTELNNFKDLTTEIKKTNQEIKVYLESNRILYSKAIKNNYALLENVKNILEENRKLYMNAFKQEKEKLDKLEKKSSIYNILRVMK